MENYRKTEPSPPEADDSDDGQDITEPVDNVLSPNGHLPDRGADLAISKQRIQVTTETVNKLNHSPIDLNQDSDLPTCHSPSRIPSSKNSAVTAMVISEDLKKLESRLEKFVPKISDRSACSEGSDNSGKSVTNVVSRLHYSQTASSRVKVSEQLGSVSPQEKTSNMLKTTLRKITRFSMGGTGKKKEVSEEEAKKSNIEVEPKLCFRNPFNGKSRIPKFQSPAPVVGRNKSFKEPVAPSSRLTSIPSMAYSGSNGSTARKNVYTSSLRRTKMKHQSSESEAEGREAQHRDQSTSRPISKFESVIPFLTYTDRELVHCLFNLFLADISHPIP